MKNPIIVALDIEDASAARTLIHRLDGVVSFYKIGLELFSAEGPVAVRDIVGAGNDVFVDLKMYDIGETVKRATARVAALGARFLTVHAHPQVIRAAKEGAAGSKLKILAVTVLTSFGQSDLDDLGVGRTVPEQVEFLVRKGIDAGTDGFICSPLEVARVRAIAGPEAILVTPGVRSAGADKGDQQRVATPREAMANGADWLVIGREITRAPNPAAVSKSIIDMINTDMS